MLSCDNLVAFLCSLFKRSFFHFVKYWSNRAFLAPHPPTRIISLILACFWTMAISDALKIWRYYFKSCFSFLLVYNHKISWKNYSPPRIQHNMLTQIVKYYSGVRAVTCRSNSQGMPVMMIQYSVRQYNAMQCSTVQSNATQYNTIQYNIMQYNTIQCHTIQYNTR